MTPTGAELHTDLPKEIENSRSAGANYGARMPDDPELSLVVERWPLLSETVRNEIVAMAVAETVK
jgi:hypothetical protein